ncbi:hypothetical protein MMAGJ_77660 [Mycolicibacterium mageritense]|uniref:Uncharacterized protein n=1 Tax=Mycolicibacterium mageritense TaxID=53462 RepID=A0ABM7I6B7_MYCME|nr:hypothetical protein MMAGJ_77660 [Mycolicibacterium mageritense]GJJ19861.1 hypothetical protein MTY414_35340 [Mycolicibacterium mageritense]
MTGIDTERRALVQARCEREPGGNPGLSRSGMQERPPSSALALPGWEATATRSTLVRACESEDLPAVPGAPRPVAHRLAEQAVAEAVHSWRAYRPRLDVSWR